MPFHHCNLYKCHSVSSNALRHLIWEARLCVDTASFLLGTVLGLFSQALIAMLLGAFQSGATYLSTIEIPTFSLCLSPVYKTCLPKGHGHGSSSLQFSLVSWPPTSPSINLEFQPAFLVFFKTSQQPVGTRPIIPASVQSEAGGAQFQIPPGSQSRFKARLGNLGRPCLKEVRGGTEDIAQLTEHWLNMCEALGSNPSMGWGGVQS